ncbi:MAG: hypothetical protein HYZ72_19310 [Deltaproteobacteria bacterium]|nr:hypothetical protein [Deltaproteobacteria bacterium]
MAEKDLDRAMAELRAEEHGLREQITQLEAEGPHVSLEDAIDAAKRELGKFRAVLKGIGRNKGDLTERQKRSMLEAFVDRVTVRVKKGESLGVSAAKPHARLSLRMHMKDADMPPDVIAEGSPLSITVRLPWTDRTLKAIPRDLLCRKTPPCPIASDEKGMTSVP